MDSKNSPLRGELIIFRFVLTGTRLNRDSTLPVAKLLRLSWRIPRAEPGERGIGPVNVGFNSISQSEFIHIHCSRRHSHPSQ